MTKVRNLRTKISRVVLVCLISQNQNNSSSAVRLKSVYEGTSNIKIEDESNQNGDYDFELPQKLNALSNKANAFHPSHNFVLKTTKDAKKENKISKLDVNNLKELRTPGFSAENVQKSIEKAMKNTINIKCASDKEDNDSSPPIEAWVVTVLESLVNNTYFKGRHVGNNLSAFNLGYELPQNPLYEEDILGDQDEDKTLIDAILLTKRLYEWFPENEGFFSQYLWSPHEHIRRAIMYGKPKTSEDLIRMIIPDRRGLWRHKMRTKADIIAEDEKDNQLFTNWLVHCEDCQKTEVKFFEKDKKPKNQNSHTKILENSDLLKLAKTSLDLDRSQEINIKALDNIEGSSSEGAFAKVHKNVIMKIK